jgi:NAD(P)-dependent dehydrogenase (short-subunit alcohol dehydrogenase family)
MESDDHARHDSGDRPQAVVVGAAGGIGAALVEALEQRLGRGAVLGLSRRGRPPLDLLDEPSIAAAATHVARQGAPLRLLLVASGFLHGEGFMPEKGLQQIDRDHLAHAFAVNAIGPALVLKHFVPLLVPQGRTVVAVLSARVGSIGDNRLGGWYGYRASKAALNQIVHTAAIELHRSHPEAICVALHPGTVATRLSAPFAKTGLDVQAPATAAQRLLAVIDGLTPAQSGGFIDYQGRTLPW